MWSFTRERVIGNCVSRVTHKASSAPAFPENQTYDSHRSSTPHGELATPFVTGRLARKAWCPYQCFLMMQLTSLKHFPTVRTSSAQE